MRTHARALTFTFSILLIFFMFGCGALSTALSAVEESDIAIRLSTAEYINGDLETAQRVAALAIEVQQRLDGDSKVKFDRLSERADTLIPWHKMSPAQRVVTQELFAHIEQRLLGLVVAGELPPDGVASLRKILAIIQRAADREVIIAEAGH